MDKVLISAQQGQLVPDADLRNDGVNRADLDSRLPTAVPQVRRSNMILAIRLYQRKRREAGDDLGPGLRGNEALKQFLEYHSSGHDDIRSGKRILQSRNLRLSRRCIAPESQRPDAGVDEQRHLRERSRL